MIENYADKKARKKVKVEKSPTGNVIFSEEKFNEDDGTKYFKVALETSPDHLQMMKGDLTRTFEMQKEATRNTQALIKAINEMIPDVVAVLAPPPQPQTATTPKADAPVKATTPKKKTKQQEKK